MPNLLMMALSGKFTVPADIPMRENQCGAVGQSEFSYHVTIESDTDHLDSRGFVIDRNDVYGFFNTFLQDEMELQSCEGIAMQAVKGLSELLGEAALRLEVTVDGIDPQRAGLTAFWTRETGCGVGCLLPRSEAHQHRGWVDPAAISEAKFPRLPHWLDVPLVFFGAGLISYVVMHSSH